MSGIIPERATKMSFMVLISKPSGLSPTVYTFTFADERSRKLVRCGSEYMKLYGAGPEDSYLTYLSEAV